MQGQLKAAEQAARAALEFSRSPAALFVLAQILRMAEDPEGCAALLLEAQKLFPHDIPLAREALRAALDAGNWQGVIEAYEALPTSVAQDGRTSMLYANALLHLNQADAAEAVLLRGGGLVVGDIRECETSLTQLYLNVAAEKARQAGKNFDLETASVPKALDFRMFVKKSPT